MYGGPLREPDVLDAMLLRMEGEMRHEARMQEIRQMDVEAWAAEQMANSEQTSGEWWDEITSALEVNGETVAHVKDVTVGIGGEEP